MKTERRVLTREELERAARKNARLEDVAATGLDLTGARLSRLAGDFMDLSRANLSGADLLRAHFMDCDFVAVRCDRADFGGATFFQCDFGDSSGEGADFGDAHASITWWDRANLPRADFSAASIAHSRFAAAGLEDATFDRAHGEEVDFHDARLSRASFRNARLPDADFRGADLREADFVFADLTGADFTGAVLEGAKFGGATIDRARFDGDPPATEPRPLVADHLTVLECLREGDGQRAVELYRSRPGSWVTSALHHCEHLDRAATEVLVRHLLGEDSLLVLHRTCRNAAYLIQQGVVLDIVGPLSALLGGGTAVHAPGPGEARFTMNPGLEAAFALGSLMCRPDTGSPAETSLRAGLDGKAVVVERCAAGLTLGLALEERWTEIEELLSSGRRRVQQGVLRGLERRIEAARERSWKRRPWGDVYPVFAIFDELHRHPDAKLAKFAQVRGRSIQSMRRSLTGTPVNQAGV
ncbi:pentapeptide repeat-containing protein [Streptosporangium sp. NPDC049248]|uniref:pentapeptide repeat-containing protein n=1 Tax=Streptosporangium sp. NPDC049248 TaxID=3155651 RepID=UPI003415CF04